MLKSMLAPSPEIQKNFARSERKKSVAVAVVGCGYWGSKHVRVLSSIPQVSHVYAVDGDPKIRQQIASEYLNTTAVESLSQVLDYVDGVVVATPSQYHADVAIQALNSGRGVLIEKPIATSLRDAERIRDAARSNGAILIAGHTYEFNPILHDLKRRIDAGELGEIRYLHSARLNLGPYRSDVSVVWDLAPHDISIMNYLMGETPSQVRAWGASCAGQGILDIAQFQLEYPTRGVTGTCANAWIDPRRVRQLIVVGSEKMAVLDEVSDEKLKIYDYRVQLPNDYAGLRSPLDQVPVAYCKGDVVIPKIDQREPLQVENRHFVDALLNPSSHSVESNTGVEVVRVLEAIDQALISGKPVSLRGRSPRRIH